VPQHNGKKQGTGASHLCFLFLFCNVSVQVPSLGPNKLWKLKNTPLRVGNYMNGKVTASAKVVWADAYKTNTIVVHRINRVLASCPM